jgi:hypothetical protein
MDDCDRPHQKPVDRPRAEIATLFGGNDGWCQRKSGHDNNLENNFHSSSEPSIEQSMVILSLRGNLPHVTAWALFNLKVSEMAKELDFADTLSWAANSGQHKAFIRTSSLETGAAWDIFGRWNGQAGILLV